jgi:hypothetical protein
MTDLNQKTLSPKFGVQWHIKDDLCLRLAIFRSVKPAVFASQTIQPIQIAGFSQFFDDARGTDAWRYGIGLDAHIIENVNAGLELSRRDWKESIGNIGGDRVLNISRWQRNSNELRGYLYWAFGPQWVLIAESQHDEYNKEKGPPVNTPRHVRTLSVPISVRYFSSSGVFGSVGATASIKMS